MTDPAECDLDQDLARAWFRDRNILENNGFRVGVETLGAHRLGHGVLPVSALNLRPAV
jgi:hypothetical protein